MTGTLITSLSDLKFEWKHIQHPSPGAPSKLVEQEQCSVHLRVRSL